MPLGFLNFLFIALTLNVVQSQFNNGFVSKHFVNDRYNLLDDLPPENHRKKRYGKSIFVIKYTFFLSIKY